MYITPSTTSGVASNLVVPSIERTWSTHCNSRFFTFSVVI